MRRETWAWLLPVEDRTSPPFVVSGWPGSGSVRTLWGSKKARKAYNRSGGWGRTCDRGTWRSRGDAQERLGGVFDGVFQPDVAIELVPVADQEAGGAQSLPIARVGLVGGQHGDDHPVVGHVVIERFDDPIAPPPDVRLALATSAP